MNSRTADGFVLLEVLVAALILTAGVVTLFEAISGSLRTARAADELTRSAFTLEAGAWTWKETGRWPAEAGETAVRHEESREGPARRATLSVLWRKNELSLTAYR